MLRMSLAVETLLTMCADAEEHDNSINPGENPDTDALEVDDEQASSIAEKDHSIEDDEETDQNSNSDKVRTVGPQAING